MSLNPMPLVRPVGVDRYVPVGDVRFHVNEWGDPSKPSVAILHGIMGNAREWDLMAAELATDFRVLSIDQQGTARRTGPASTRRARWSTTSPGCSRRSESSE